MPKSIEYQVLHVCDAGIALLMKIIWFIYKVKTIN